jgi:hypothetical protein
MGRHTKLIYVTLALTVTLLSIAACGGDDAETAPGTTKANPTATGTAGASAAATRSPQPTPQLPAFDPSKFSHPTNIDNEWYPLQPGTKWVYEGYTTDYAEQQPHRLEFTVTDLTKEIQGIRTVVAWIEDFSNNEVVEREIAFYAQDDDGNVWYFGEHPEEWDKDQLVEAPTWIAGLKNAKPGIKMWAEPKLGMPSYYQGWGPGVDWSDYAQIDQTAQETCVPLACYQDVLVLAESSLGEGDVYQIKYYERGVGEVRVGWRGPPNAAEELALVEVTQLDQAGVAAVRADALALEAHAYQISKEVYAKTAAAQ